MWYVCVYIYIEVSKYIKFKNFKGIKNIFKKISIYEVLILNIKYNIK